MRMYDALSSSIADGCRARRDVNQHVMLLSVDQHCQHALTAGERDLKRGLELDLMPDSEVEVEGVVAVAL